MFRMKNCSTFYRPIRGLTSRQQRELCATAASKLGLTVASEYDAAEIDGARDEWVKQLARRREVGIVAKLEVVAETRKVVKSPTADYAAALMEAVQASAFIVDAFSGITSRDGRKWRNLVEKGASIVSAGRILTPARARKLVAKRWAKALPGTVEVWLQPHMRPQREALASIWRDSAYANDQEAFEALPVERQQEFGSSSTVRRIFGRRRPRDKSAGGRPRKQKS